jgi:hypothetical protein
MNGGAFLLDQGTSRQEHQPAASYIAVSTVYRFQRISVKGIHSFLRSAQFDGRADVEEMAALHYCNVAKSSYNQQLAIIRIAALGGGHDRGYSYL